MKKILMKKTKFKIFFIIFFLCFKNTKKSSKKKHPKDIKLFLKKNYLFNT